MKKPLRRIISQLLTVIFVLMILTPLAPLAKLTTSVELSIAGGCSGDCNTCGCSLERSSTHTCCCWQKKNKLQEEQEFSQDMATCCKPKQSLQNKKQNKTVSIKSYCPCERYKFNAIFSNLDLLLVTSHITEIDPVYTEQRKSAYFQMRMTDRHGEPPDPPPKLVICS